MRAETKPHEQRTILLPEHVEKLVAAGHTVAVEESSQRCMLSREFAPFLSEAIIGSFGEGYFY